MKAAQSQSISLFSEMWPHKQPVAIDRVRTTYPDDAMAQGAVNDPSQHRNRLAQSLPSVHDLCTDATTDRGKRLVDAGSTDLANGKLS